MRAANLRKHCAQRCSWLALDVLSRRRDNNEVIRQRIIKPTRRSAHEGKERSIWHEPTPHSVIQNDNCRRQCAITRKNSPGGTAQAVRSALSFSWTNASAQHVHKGGARQRAATAFAVEARIICSFSTQLQNPYSNDKGGSTTRRNRTPFAPPAFGR